MNIIVSIETVPYVAAQIAEGGCYTIPACKLNDELKDPAVRVVFDARRRVFLQGGGTEVREVSSKYLCFGPDGNSGILNREDGWDWAAFAVPRYVHDPDPTTHIGLKLGQAKTLSEIRKIADEFKYPPEEAFPTTEELRALYARRVERDKRLIALGDQLFNESNGNAKHVIGNCRWALVRLGVHRPWETFAETDQIEAQKRFLESLNPNHPLAAAKRLIAA